MYFVVEGNTGVVLWPNLLTNSQSESHLPQTSLLSYSCRQFTSLELNQAYRGFLNYTHVVMNVTLDAQITDASVKKTPSGKRYHAVNHACGVLKKKPTSKQLTSKLKLCSKFNVVFTVHFQMRYVQ